jgi:hypothetical protein
MANYREDSTASEDCCVFIADIDSMPIRNVTHFCIPDAIEIEE